VCQPFHCLLDSAFEDDKTYVYAKRTLERGQNISFCYGTEKLTVQEMFNRRGIVQDDETFISFKEQLLDCAEPVFIHFWNTKGLEFFKTLAGLRNEELFATYYRQAEQHGLHPMELTWSFSTSEPLDIPFLMLTILRCLQVNYKVFYGSMDQTPEALHEKGVLVPRIFKIIESLGSKNSKTEKVWPFQKNMKDVYADFMDTIINDRRAKFPTDNLSFLHQFAKKDKTAQQDCDDVSDLLKLLIVS
jgi:hypothetical protein